MNKAAESYHWRIYEKLLLCLASGICSGLIMWLGMVLLWNGFSYPEQKINPFFSRLIFGSSLLFFFASSYFYPRIYILPIWVLNLIILYFQFTFIIGTVVESYDMSSPFFAPDSTAWYDQIHLFDVLILTTMIISLCGLLRPAMFYARDLWRDIFV